MAGSEIVSNLLPFISWAILPHLLTKVALRGLYGVQIVPRPTTPAQAQLHARRVQALVIVAYLAYTVYSSVFRRSANYYELLGVPLDCDGDDVRRSFRKLARIYHPDKAGGRQADEQFFIELRRAHDCLADPLRRTAYDRFGPSVLEKRELLTERDIFMQGLQTSLSFYVVHPIMHGFVNWLSGRKVMTYWLLTLYVVLLASEFTLIVRGQRWYGSGLLPATMTAHDLISSLHSAFTALFLASAHLGNILPTLRDANVSAPFNHLFDGAASENDLAALRELILQQEARVADIRVQSGRNMDMMLLPLRPTPKASAPTIQQAAHEAARRRSRLPNEIPNSVPRQPSRIEQAYIFRLSQLILRHRLEVIPAVREAEKQRSKAKENSKKDATATEDKKKASETLVYTENGRGNAVGEVASSATEDTSKDQKLDPASSDTQASSAEVS